MKIHRNQYLRILLISYMAMLLIPLITGGFNYFISKEMIEDEVFRANVAIMKQACSYIDNALSQEELLAIDIGLNPRINEFINAHGPIDEANRYKLYNIVKDMSIYKNKYSFISDFYVFFKNSNHIATPTSVYTPWMFYEYAYGYQDIAFQEWESTILNGYHENTLIVPHSIKQRPNDRYLTYVYSLPINAKQNICANLVVLIDEQNIKKLLGDLKWLNNGLLYVTDKDGQIITSNDSNISIEDFPELKLEGNEGYEVIESANGSMALSYISSNQQGWKYISLMPMDIYMERVSDIKRITVVIFLASLVSGLIVAVLFAYRNYSPVRKIMGIISTNDTESSEKHFNEFEYIQKTIEHTFEEDKKILVMLEEQKPIIRDNLIRRLLEGRINLSEASSRKSLHSFGIDFPYEMFAVILFNFDKQQILSDGYTEAQYTLSKLKISDYIIQLFTSNNIKSYINDVDSENIALLVNVSGSNANTVTDRLNLFANKALSFIKDTIGICCSVGIGSIYRSVSDINKSYLEVIRALDYKMLKGYGSIVRYEDIVKSDQSYYYPLETEQQLMNYLKSGELESAKKTFDYLFEENVNKRTLSPDMLKLLFSDMVGTIVKIIINEIKTDYQSVFRDDFNPITCLSDCVTTEEIRIRFYTIFNNLCTFINNNKKSHNTKLINKITKYVKKEYANPELCLQLIASVFNISVPYLSRFFKEQTGENLNNYINNMRIEKSKELLRIQDVSISDVATHVGFNNHSSFIRVFKKVTGKTPGAYRQNPE